ncbi:MAG: SPFH domain-containing protein [Anaerolineae bacterium]|nr:SPFH domain-containing protein [Thermoflexales bacterium]MDW8395291.1 SPFH domain-containing protein [Anaerolineae bacterium]
MPTGFQFLSVIGWGLLLVLALYVAVIASQRSQGRPAKFSVSLIAILLVGWLGLNTLSAGLVFIPPQERGLVINLFTGLREPVLTPGVHFVVPIIESVKRYSIVQRTYTMSRSAVEGDSSGVGPVTARTADGQEVFIDASVTYRVDPEKLAVLYVKWQDNYEEGLVRPRARSIIYNAVAAYGVEEVYSTKREALQARITEQLAEALANDGLELSAFLLRNITFNQEYANSVEQKQIAEQNAQRARFLVEQERQEAERVRVQAQGQADAAVTRAKAEAEAQIIRAKAEAEALSLIGAQLKDNPALLTYRYIEKLSPGVQTIFLPANQPFLLDPSQFIGPVRPSTPAAPPTPEPTPTPIPQPTPTPQP